MLPSVDRVWTLMELAYETQGLTVLGWTSNSVAEAGAPVVFEVTPTPESPVGHEDQMIVVLVRVPHPDEMSLAEVVFGHEMHDDLIKALS